jgi:purine nucleoside permease
MAAGLSLMSLLSWEEYDFSDSIIVSVGCGGGNTGSMVFGDVVLVTAACDAELGHHTDSTDLENPDTGITWFPAENTVKYASLQLNSDLYDKLYPMVRDCPLRTTETSKRVLAENYPGEKWADREPCVTKGTAVTGDSYWKGDIDHNNACYIAEYYKCPDAYAVTEMEEVAVMNAARCFGMEDRVVSLRVIVNMDTFLKGESPEKVWIGEASFDSKVTKENTETLDIFKSGMENLFDVGQIVIDAILAGDFDEIYE